MFLQFEKKFQIWNFTLTGLALIFSFSVSAQQYAFTPISASQGLPQKYVYDIIQDQSGFMWIGTGEGLCRYDGHEIITYLGKNNLAENFCGKIFEASGGDLWIGHNQGGITVKIKNTFTKVLGSDDNRGPVVDFAEPENGCIVAAFQKGTIMVNRGNKTNTFPIGEDNCYIYAITVHEHTLVVFTSQGQYRVKFNRNGHPFIQLLSKEIWNDEKIQGVFADINNPKVYWGITSGGQLLQGTFNGMSKLVFKPVELKEPLENVQKMVQAPDGTLWIATFNGVYCLRYNSEVGNLRLINHYHNQNGLPSLFVKTVFIDQESNAWFGLYGEGMVALNDEYFTFYRYPKLLSTNDIKSLLVLTEQTWLGTDNGLLCINPDDESKNIFYNGNNGLRTETVTALCDMNGQVIAGTASGGLFVFTHRTGKWSQHLVDNDNLKNQVTTLQKSADGLWVGTRGGLFLLDQDLQIKHSWSTVSGLVHNNINCIYVDDDQSVWVGMPGNKVAHITNYEVENIEVTGPSQFVDISCITKDHEGKLWIGTSGNGIIVKKDNKVREIKMSNGLPSDYVYSIISDKNNGIWVGHRGSLTRIDAHTLKLSVFDQRYGISQEFNPLASVRDHAGNIWFGTSNGVLRFDPTKMRTNRTPPRLILKEVWNGDKKLDVSEAADLPYGSYKFKFNFIGISLNKPQQVKYRYMLEGFDTEWSDFTSVASVTYPKLQEGDYVFKVQAYNADGFAGKPTVLYQMHISIPLWKRWWFFVVLAAVLIVLVTLIIRIREENQQRMLNLLEKNLAIRTTQLREQKKLVEEQNKDIVDSINYALRIQTALLPEIRMLKKHLPDSFVSYKPRDIVSGDFYWFNHVNGRLLLACADCTGHGVPGAFMSMIGNTLFNEILPVSDEQDPAQMLYRIDGKMRQLLQKDSAETLFDGMDLVLLSLDLETGILDFAGAFRPLLHFSDNKMVEYKTSRYSIGGPISAKEFTNQRIQLKKGDTVYIFTDGIIDQFGGPQRRKLRSKGLTDLLQDIQPYSMEEQRFMVEQFFHKWTNGEKQIDDVLIIGFRY